MRLGVHHPTVTSVTQQNYQRQRQQKPPTAPVNLTFKGTLGDAAMMTFTGAASAGSAWVAANTPNQAEKVIAGIASGLYLAATALVGYIAHQEENEQNAEQQNTETENNV